MSNSTTADTGRHDDADLDDPLHDQLPAVAPAVAALTFVAAGLTLAAGIWLWRASRGTDRRARFPAPAVHRPR